MIPRSFSLKIVKITSAAGRLAGLPLPSCEGLPTSVVSKAEVQAVANLEALLGGAADIGEAASKKVPRAATGQAYKYLRKVLKDQCHDEYLTHCALTKVGCLLPTTSNFLLIASY